MSQSETENDVNESESSTKSQVELEKELADLRVELENTNEELAEVKEQRDEFKEKFLKKTADYKNFRVRKNQELEKLKKYSGEEALKAMIEVLDDLDRVLSETDFESDETQEGIEMIHRQFQDKLKKQGVERMKAEGEQFDPQRHEAMMQRESEEYDSEVVLNVVRAGYMFHDRVLRPARVVVSEPAKKK